MIEEAVNNAFKLGEALKQFKIQRMKNGILDEFEARKLNVKDYRDVKKKARKQ